VTEHVAASPSALAAGAPARRSAEPARRLGAAPALALVAGSMLGIGIFISPPEVAANIRGPGLFLTMWLLGGVAALFGALSLAELGAMMPRSGGDYAYLRLGYGKGVAFAAGWLQLLAIFPGSLASVAVATSTYQLPVLLGPSFSEPVGLLGLTIPASHFWAAVIIIALTVINHIGVHVSGAVQVLVTSIPLSVLLIATMFVLGDRGLSDAVASGQMSFGGESHGLSSLARAYLPVYFAYSGWNAAIYVGGEIRDPGRNLPRALVGGTLLVTVLYMLLCTGFLAVFSMDDLAGVGEAGTAAARTMFGPGGILAITGLILLAMLGSMNGTVLTGSRIGFAMAQKGDCLRSAAHLHPRFGTPTVALWLQAVLALALLLTGKHLGELIEYTSSAMLITGTLTVLAVVVLRRRMTKTKRPYRTWMYPLPPLLYAVSSVLVLGVLVVDGDSSVWAAVIWFALALGFYRIRARRQASASA
jgi:APA family basic amino acid/polyamine antiporter